MAATRAEYPMLWIPGNEVMPAVGLATIDDFLKAQGYRDTMETFCQRLSDQVLRSTIAIDLPPDDSSVLNDEERTPGTYFRVGYLGPNLFSMVTTRTPEIRLLEAFGYDIIPSLVKRGFGTAARLHASRPTEAFITGQCIDPPEAHIPNHTLGAEPHFDTIGTVSGYPHKGSFLRLCNYPRTAVPNRDILDKSPTTLIIPCEGTLATLFRGDQHPHAGGEFGIMPWETPEVARAKIANRVGEEVVRIVQNVTEDLPTEFAPWEVPEWTSVVVPYVVSDPKITKGYRVVLGTNYLTPDDPPGTGDHFTDMLRACVGTALYDSLLSLAYHHGGSIRLPI
jgi:hypothetical protein